MVESKEMKNGMTQKKKDAVIEQLKLFYYNDALYARGLITEERRNQMRYQIKYRTSMQLR
ncbi:MAG: hypothetical protein IKC03_04450 [Oscillospiraceae bacterium]|nr:hypothetical protein [Oscillospiraceae bacterium]